MKSYHLFLRMEYIQITKDQHKKIGGNKFIYPNTSRKCYLTPMKQNVISSNNEMPGQNFEEQRFSKDPFNQKNRKNKECEASNWLRSWPYDKQAFHCKNIKGEARIEWLGILTYKTTRSSLVHNIVKSRNYFPHANRKQIRYWKKMRYFNSLHVLLQHLTKASLPLMLFGFIAFIAGGIFFFGLHCTSALCFFTRVRPLVVVTAVLF